MVTGRTPSGMSGTGRAVTGQIVVAWDGSPPARAALDWALERTGAGDLRLVRVIDRTMSTAEYFVAESTQDALRTAVLEEGDRLRTTHPDLHVSAEVLPGDPIEELRRLSTEDALVVVGTHRRDGPTVRYAWSVGARLAGSANGPVAIIPEPGGPAGTGVVAGVDGSVTSNLAVEFAAAEAVRTGQVLTLIHAWQEPLLWRDEVTPDVDFIDSLEVVHQRTLDAATEAVREHYPRLAVESALIRGAAQWALLDAARGAALLVVGNHGSHGVKRLLLGSVSHSIVLNIQSPTVVMSLPAEE